MGCYNNHKVFNTLLSEFIDENLSIEEASKFIAHCESCVDCMEDLRWEVLTRLIFDDKLGDNPEEEVDQIINEKFYKIKKRMYMNDIILRHMKLFVIGSFIFIILSYIVELIF